MRVAVNEAYRGWNAPAWLHPVTVGLLAAVDERYLAGLSAVVLTNTGALTGDRKRGKTWSRSRKVRLDRCLGLYHHRTIGEAAWVELFADKVLAGAPAWVWRIPVLRDGLLADSLYHEIGHHIYANQAPESRERENVADDWRDRLVVVMHRRRHPIIHACARAVRKVMAFVRRMILALPKRRSGRGREVAT